MPAPEDLAIKEAAQRLSLDVFHDDEVDAVFTADVEDGADVGMAERGERARLALEAASGLGIGQQLRTKDLQRDAAVEPCVSRLEDLSHPAAADRRDDLIRSEAAAGESSMERVRPRLYRPISFPRLRETLRRGLAQACRS